MRTLELNEIAHVSGGLLGAESGSFLCDASDTRPPGTNAWGEVPTDWDHFMSAFGAWKANFAAGAADFSLSAIQTVFDQGPISWLLGTNSGVGADGLRTDGAVLGYGCGDAATDRIVPDRIFNVDLSTACVRHDVSFDSCTSKSKADSTFKQDIYDLLIKGNVNPVLASVTAEIYYQGVNLGGQAAYDKACPAPKP